MDNKLRLERLTELQGMLTHHDQLFQTKEKDVKFDICTWQSSCGTAACALGSAALHKPFQDQGLTIEGSGWGWSEPKYDGKSEFAAGAKFFGITMAESNALFDPDAYIIPRNYTACRKNKFKAVDYHSEVTPQVVAERVAKLIEKYKGE